MVKARGVEPASALALPKTESGATDTLGYANNKREAEASLLLLVDLRGVEPLSENLLIQLSPGAGCLLGLFLCRAGTQARKGSNRFMRDRFNGKPPMHVHH